MNYINEPEKKIPVLNKVDVVVLGAGPAGFSAAICAAREGAVTMLVEQAGDVGGIATVGLMSHWTGRTEGGFYEEILNRSTEAKETARIHEFNGSDRQIINPERLKTVLLEMLEEAGVILQLYTFASDVIMENDVIKGVIVESKSGREAILADIVIDATGDGDIAAKASVPYCKGRETDGKMQPMTIMFKVAGVEVERGVFPGGFEETFQIPAGDIQQLGREYIPSPAGHVLLYKTTLPDVVTCNMTNCINVDGTSASDLTKATIQCRKQMDIIVDFLRKCVPGFEKCYLISSASLIGVRETRHFQGESTITEQDIMEARVFEDWAVTKASFNFDVHNLSGNGLDETGCQKHFKQTKGYTIPYGCFVPLKVDNLYLAGRNISGTHMAHSNYRVMPICANMGQSVGIAAALCIKEKVKPRNLDIKLLQSKLLTYGVSPY
jgi:ribulose 1,5-bisphosphate synthetase/thiazole synthase